MDSFPTKLNHHLQKVLVLASEYSFRELRFILDLLEGNGIVVCYNDKLFFNIFVEIITAILIINGGLLNFLRAKVKI